MGVLCVAPIVMKQTRPDVSARLLAPLAPLLHGMAWESGRRLWAQNPLGAKRWAVGYMVLCFGLFPVFGAYGTIGQYTTRMNVEKEAKALVAKQLKSMHCPLLIVTNRDHELSIEELERMGVVWSDCNSIFIPNTVRLDPSPNEFEQWKMQGHTYKLKAIDLKEAEKALLAGHPPKRCALLYVQTPRARMDTHEYWRFSGDFGWAFSHLPEFDEEVYIQQIEIQYREGTGYESLFQSAGARRYQVDEPFDLLPLNPNEWLWRVFTDFPIVEEYVYEANSYVFPGCGVTD
jgi:hypothetical protein